MSDGHRWSGYSHEELYQQINSGPGPKASHASMERWQGISAAMTEINSELHKGVQKSGAVWEGAAADQARGGLNPLAAWADDARTGADVMRVSAEMQADFIGKARSDMPAPVPVTAEDPGTILSALTHLVGGQTDYEQQEKAHGAAEQRAREVMATYASSTTTNTSTLGQFHQPPQLVINAAQSSLGNVHGVSGNLGGAYGVVAGGVGIGGGARVPAQGGGARPTTSPAGTSSSTTRAAGAAPSGTASTAGSTRTANGGASTSFGTSGSGGGVIGGAGGRVGSKKDSKSSDSTHAEHAAGQDAAGAGSGAAGAGRQSGVTVASGAEFGPVATPTAQHGMSSGIGGSAGGAAATTTADNDTVHRRATPMVPAQGNAFDPFGNVGGRANEEEDGEHNAAEYLRETDDIYGIGGMISPPVIGENPNS
ncbi:MAG: PPE domain-containing protein [Umezawaea sp.]